MVWVQVTWAELVLPSSYSGIFLGDIFCALVLTSSDSGRSSVSSVFGLEDILFQDEGQYKSVNKHMENCYGVIIVLS